MLITHDPIKQHLLEGGGYRDCAVTTGHGPLGRIYDRLRKRSWRRIEQWYDHSLHTEYVRGVKDALNAVKDGS